MSQSLLISFDLEAILIFCLSIEQVKSNLNAVSTEAINVVMLLLLGIYTYWLLVKVWCMIVRNWCVMFILMILKKINYAWKLSHSIMSRNTCGLFSKEDVRKNFKLPSGPSLNSFTYADIFRTIIKNCGHFKTIFSFLYLIFLSLNKRSSFLTLLSTFAHKQHCFLRVSSLPIYLHTHTFVFHAGHKNFAPALSLSPLSPCFSFISIP